MALVDGDNGMGHLVMSARPRSRSRRRATPASPGSARAAATTPARRRSMRACRCEHDMIGLYFAVGNANHLPPWGGLDMLLSTNPIAVGRAGRRRAADRARHGDHRRRLRQGQGQGAARRDDARGLDDRPPGPAADRPEARGRRLPAADRRLQGLRPGADRRPARRHAERRGDGPRRGRLQRRRHDASPTPARRSWSSTSRPSATSRRSSAASTAWCATCAPASACRASSASGCPASRATQAPHRERARRHPAAARAARRSSTRWPRELGIEPLAERTEAGLSHHRAGHRHEPHPQPYRPAPSPPPPSSACCRRRTAQAPIRTSRSA